MEAQNWHLMTTKVALAIAIIRSKPAGKTSKEYTEELALIVTCKHNQDINRKGKVCPLDIMELHQQFLLQNIPEISSSKNASADNIDLTSEPKDITRDSGETEDSGCDVLTEGETATIKEAHTSKNWIETCFTLPSSLPILGSFSVDEEHFTDHLYFLNHLLGLRKLTTAGRFTLLENECSVVEESVSRVLNGLLVLYRKHQSVSSYQSKVINTIIILLSEFRLPKYLFKYCLMKVEDFEKNLVHCIMLNKTINRFPMQQSMTDCLVLLGKCQIIRGPLINLLFSEVKRFTDELLQHCKDQTKYDISEYENIFSLFSVIEVLLQYEKETPESSKCELYNDGTKQFLDDLDQIIFCISDGFPLCCLYLWKLKTMYSCTEENLS
ncbi:hypothetical protein GDO86_009856 [Hymenochirus boettgeri]|uniref:Uncharacterized protein n=1 Tax=Hymenochirus boettgeri TaxID=247094 RepID=A0A8T2JN55_9PIPI|nr:hypothetical protein GDO86_009856 [Hymenochirus boettgeri]